MPSYEESEISTFFKRFFRVINVLHRGGGAYEPLSRSNWNCFSRGSVLVIRRQPIATCDFPGGGPDPQSPPLGPPIGWFVTSKCCTFYLCSLDIIRQYCDSDNIQGG